MSEHPLATHATGEVVGGLLESIGPDPDVAVVFVTGAHLGALDDVVAAVRATLGSGCTLGATSVGLIGGRHEVEHQPAIAIWAGRGAGVVPCRFDAGLSLVEPVVAEPGSTLVLLADPAALDEPDALDRIAAQLPGVTVVGGTASAPTGPGGNRLGLDGAVHTDGGIGALLGPDWPVRAVVSQGARPVGERFTVTRAERSMVYELAGQPALARLGAVVGALSPEARARASASLQLGWLVDDHKLDMERGDFLICPVRGGDPDTGALAIDLTAVGDRAPSLEVGSTVQFHVQDAASADEDLRWSVAGTAASAGLVFVGTQRGRRLFGFADHDAEVLTDALRPAPSGRAALAGMFTDRPVGPIGARSFAHGPGSLVALTA